MEILCLCTGVILGIALSVICYNLQKKDGVLYFGKDRDGHDTATAEFFSEKVKDKSIVVLDVKVLQTFRR